MFSPDSTESHITVGSLKNLCGHLHLIQLIRVESRLERLLN